MADKLDDFTRQFLETALFTSTDMNTDKPLDRTHSIYDFAPATLAELVADCYGNTEDNTPRFAIVSEKDDYAGNTNITRTVMPLPQVVHYFEREVWVDGMKNIGPKLKSMRVGDCFAVGSREQRDTIVCVFDGTKQP